MKFRKGESGNPQGRPPKTDHARAAQLRRRILASAPEIIDGLIQAAKAGDVAAARAVLACCVPALKPVDLPATPASLLQRIEAVEAAIQAMAQRSPALPAPGLPDSAIAESQPLPEPPRAIIELEYGETLSDAARELGITPDELHRQMDAGQIVIKPTEESQP